MKKLGKRYYILIFIAALAAALIINNFSSPAFKIIKYDAVYAPENENIEVDFVNSININTADVRLLDTLDGIGEEMAKRIVTYRTKNGNFEVIEDIMKVDGIGQKKFDAIKDYITVN